MDYFIMEKDGNKFQINNDHIVEQLNKQTLEIGKKITVFGSVPHYLTVDEIDEVIIIFKDDLWS